MNLRTATRAASTFVVGAGAALGSYTHLHTVARMAGEVGIMQAILPLTVDGMMIVATTAMADDLAHGRSPRPAAKWAFYGGIFVSIAGNITATWSHGMLARVVAMWPAIALLMVTMILDTRGKLITPDDTTAPDDVVHADATVEAPQPAVEAPTATRRHPVRAIGSHAHCAHATTPQARRICRSARS